MKIGILTFVNTINYGAVLQAYALQNKINSFGIKAEIIEYVNLKIEQKEKNTIANKFSPKYLVRKLVLGKALIKKEKKFKEYEEKYIHYGKKLNSTSISQVNRYYDKFICGSDQVWNRKLIHEDWTYFLDFVEEDKKKVSYAPSFGNIPFPKSDYQEGARLLNKFRHLSVREVTGKKEIEKICGLKAQVVVDPTLLLSKEEWIQHIKFIPPIKEYILVYFPHNKKNVFNFVNKLKQKTGLPVIYLSISPRIQRGVKTIYDASPDEFLGWIYHAKYVVTGSFHGTAFSLNLEKQFYFEPFGMEGRIGNLVRLAGVLDRNIECVDLDKDIEYSVVSKRLAKEREWSIQWLENAIFS